MRISYVLLFFILFTGISSANDGSFYASGGNLYPMEETSIELKKEILTLKKVQDNWISVDVYFEFYNPGDKRILTVGFVTPSANGDVDFETSEHPQIKDFTVILNDASLPFKINKTIDSSSKSINFDQYTYNFIYYFDAEFKNGMNIIKHSYLFRGSTGVEGTSYDYHLQTGTSWANGEIEDFELNIDLGPGIHYLPATFHSKNDSVDWKIIGTGKFYPKLRTYYGWEFDEVRWDRIVEIQSGYVSYMTKNFQPYHDLKVGEYFKEFNYEPYK
ncbi:MAG: hypothetical protein EHM58_12025 [Ignavibacteriae bacterium]|nr:MAG: hypothetical protein EHM58_12025 [Ignavibacteriota bacterium]